MNLIEGAVAVVTGAAGGMGLPCARRLAQQGYPLVLCDINPTRLDAAADELRTHGVEVAVLAGDISAADFPARVIELCGGREIGVLVHTAGISPTMGDAERVLEINWFASVRLVDAVCGHMAKGGCAVLISSSSAYMVPADQMAGPLKALLEGDTDTVRAYAKTPQQAYPLTKRGIIALVGREAVAFGARGARIVSIAPGFIDTEMGRSESRESEYMRAMMERVPLGRLGLGEDIADAAMYLASPQASYISGCDIKVDGGILGSMGM